MLNWNIWSRNSWNQQFPAASTYYLDPLSGSDSNTGTSLLHAWGTSAKAESVALSPGQSINKKIGGELILYKKATTAGPQGNVYAYYQYGSALAADSLATGGQPYPIPLAAIDWSALTHISHDHIEPNPDGTLNTAYMGIVAPYISNLITAAHANDVKVLINIADIAYEQGGSGIQISSSGSGTLTYTFTWETIGCVKTSDTVVLSVESPAIYGTTAYNVIGTGHSGTATVTGAWGNLTAELFDVTTGQVLATGTYTPGNPVSIWFPNPPVGDPFKVITASPTLLNTFVGNLVEFVLANGYDGIEIDWECGTTNIGLSALIQALYPAIKGQNPNLLVHVALGTGSGLLASQLQNFADAFTLMTYGVFLTAGMVTWFNSPLYGGTTFTEYGLQEMSCQSIMLSFLQVGVPRSAMYLGIPTYGTPCTRDPNPFFDGTAVPLYPRNPYAANYLPQGYTYYNQIFAPPVTTGYAYATQIANDSDATLGGNEGVLNQVSVGGTLEPNSSWDFYNGPYQEIGLDFASYDSPTGCNALEWWIGCYTGPSGAISTNSLVNVRNAGLYLLSNSTKEWTAYPFAAADMSGETWDDAWRTSSALTIRTESDGSWSFPVTTGYVGHCYAPWPRIPVTSDCIAIIAICEARLILNDSGGTDDRVSASFLLSCGCDPYPGTTTAGLPSNPAIGGGRSKWVGKNSDGTYTTNNWRSYAMTTADVALLDEYPPPIDLSDTVSDAPTVTPTYVPEYDYWDDLAQSPYLGIPGADPSGSQNTYVTYDDSASFTAKTAFVTSEALAGLAIWELSLDYFSTRSIVSPLLNAIKVSYPKVALTSVTPGTPIALCATAVSGSGLTLHWPGVPDATSYNVKRSTTSGSGYVTIGSVVAPGYTDSGLTSGTTYYYVASAANNGTEGANSTQLAVTASVIAITAPTDLLNSLAAPTNTFGLFSTSLSWNPVSGATSYNIWRSAGVSGGSYALIAMTSAANVVDSTLTCNCTFYYVVTAIMSTGRESAYSNEVSVTTPATYTSSLNLLESPTAINVSPWSLGGIGETATASVITCSTSGDSYLGQILTVATDTDYVAQITVTSSSGCWVGFGVYTTDWTTTLGSGSQEVVSATSTTLTATFNSGANTSVNFFLDFVLATGTITVTGASVSTVVTEIPTNLLANVTDLSTWTYNPGSWVSGANVQCVALPDTGNNVLGLSQNDITVTPDTYYLATLSALRTDSAVFAAGAGGYLAFLVQAASYGSGLAMQVAPLNYGLTSDLFVLFNSGSNTEVTYSLYVTGSDAESATLELTNLSVTLNPYGGLT